jgi:hypothetical protein
MEEQLMKEYFCKDLGGLEEYISEEKRDTLFRDALEAIEYTIQNGKEIADIACFHVEDEEDSFIFNVRQDEWGEVLRNAISFYEELEEFEMCERALKTLKLTEKYESNEHSEEELFD